MSSLIVTQPPVLHADPDEVLAKFGLAEQGLTKVSFRQIVFRDYSEISDASFSATPGRFQTVNPLLHKIFSGLLYIVIDQVSKSYLSDKYSSIYYIDSITRQIDGTINSCSVFLLIPWKSMHSMRVSGSMAAFGKQPQATSKIKLRSGYGRYSY